MYSSSTCYIESMLLAGIQNMINNFINQNTPHSNNYTKCNKCNTFIDKNEKCYRCYCIDTNNFRKTCEICNDVFIQNHTSETNCYDCRYKKCKNNT